MAVVELIKNSNAFQRGVEWARERRHNIPPEREYIFGAATIVLYSILLMAPERLSTSDFESLQPFVEVLLQAKETVYATIALGILLTIDGAARISAERLPLLKAYLQVYVVPALFGKDPE